MNRCDDMSTSGFITPVENEVLPRFTELEEIPSAGFNVIARAKRYGRWWIVKGLKEEFREDALYKELLKKEFEILISMQHPGVIAGVGMEPVEGLGVCIVMEWVDGCSLKEWLRKPHSFKERWRITLQLIDALEYIHDKQTVHRDLKPSNILVTRNGQYVKLIDFGLSDTDDYTIFKQPAGSKGYLSPEQASGGKSDVRNDIYSLGCVLDDLQLGARYKRVVRKCKSRVDKRYSCVGDVRRALVGHSRFGWYAGGIVAVVVLASIAAFLLPHNQNNTTSSSAPTAPKPDSKMEQKIDTLKTQIESVDNEIQNTKKQEGKIESAIAEGKRRMDAVVVRSGWEQVNDIGVFGDLLFSVANEMNAVWENYPQELDSTYTQIDRAQVREVLTAYYTKLYMPIYNKYVQLQSTDSPQ